MKKFFITTLATFLLFNSSMTVNAAHAHSENCYIVQEVHTHTGNSANGGGCYGTANYHVHSGDSANGGGCYGIANYHVHSGNTASGGACYATANYHVHSGQPNQSVANGCYTKEETTEIICGTYTLQNDVYICALCTFMCGSGSYGYYKNVPHTTSTGQSCEPTHLNYAGSNKCSGCGAVVSVSVTGTHMKSATIYSLGCGKTTDTVESYSLSCTKSTTTAESYTLSCGKTAETIESYSLNCGKEEGQVTRVLICTISNNNQAAVSTSFTLQRITLKSYIRKAHIPNYYIASKNGPGYRM